MHKRRKENNEAVEIQEQPKKFRETHSIDESTHSQNEAIATSLFVRVDDVQEASLGKISNDSDIKSSHSGSESKSDKDLESNSNAEEESGQDFGEDSNTKNGQGEDDIRIFSKEELEIIMDDARCDGFWTWMARYSRFGVPSLLHAFGVPKSSYAISGMDPESMMDEQLRILRSVFGENVQRRTRLQKYHSFHHAVELIKKSKKIIVLTGAGVSVSCGIPDFRSKNGIYSRLSEFQLSDPQEMFDLEYFKFKPETFYAFAKEIYPSNFKPSPSHMFIKMLEDQGKLLRNYTQNIDTLENIAGINRVVQCHGSFATAKCIECGHQVPGKEIEEDIFAQRVPDCKACKEGIMKPDIVFFGENLPKTFHDCFASDRNEVDLLIVMGSSLKVAPVANVMHRIPIQVPQILVNMESLSHMANFDIHLLGYSDIVVQELSKALLNNETEEELLPNNVTQGPLPWQWLFEGAVDPASKLVESDFSSSEDSDNLTDDSNTISETDENQQDHIQDEEDLVDHADGFANVQ